MRIYVSGPMTGKPEFNYPAFNAAAKRLRDEGHFVINPAELSAIFGTPGEIEDSFSFVECLERIEHDGDNAFDDDDTDATKRSIILGLEKEATLARSLMSADLAAVRSCDAIYLLPGWESSRGAKKELAEAIANGLKIIQQGGD